MLYRLTDASIQQLSSDQVITSLASAVKELLENALDAGSTLVEVRLQGLSLISVRDNGSGVKKEDCQQMAQRHFTSKLQQLDDLDTLNTYGFRGEALHSICNCSASVSITTRTVDDPAATQYRLDKSGKIISEQVVAAGVGTAITVTELFNRMPVRRQEAERAWNVSIKSITDMLVCYGLIYPPVRLLFKYEKDRKSAPSVWQKNPVPTSIDVLRNIYGSPFAGNFFSTNFHATIYDEHGRDSAISINAILPKIESALGDVSRSTADRCFVFVNRRPVEMKQIVKLVREIYLKFHDDKSKRFPSFMVDISMEAHLFDVNVEPAKNVIFVHNEEQFNAIIKKFMENAYPQLCSMESAELEMDNNSMETLPPTGKTQNAGDIQEQSIEHHDKIAEDVLEPTSKLSEAVSSPVEKETVFPQIDQNVVGTEKWAKGEIEGLQGGAVVLTSADFQKPTINDEFAGNPKKEQLLKSAFDVMLQASKALTQQQKQSAVVNKNSINEDRQAFAKAPIAHVPNPEFRLSLPVESSFRHTLVDLPDRGQQSMRKRFEIIEPVSERIASCDDQRTRSSRQMSLENYLTPTTPTVNSIKPNLTGKCLLTADVICRKFHTWLKLQTEPEETPLLDFERDKVSSANNIPLESVTLCDFTLRIEDDCTISIGKIFNENCGENYRILAISSMNSGLEKTTFKKTSAVSLPGFRTTNILTDSGLPSTQTQSCP